MSDREQPPRNPQRAPAARDPKAIEAARRFLSETLGQMGFTASVEVREEADETIFEIVGPDATHIVGKKGREYFKRRNAATLGREWAAPSTSATALATAREIAHEAIQLFLDDQVDAVYLVYNEFKSVIQQRVEGDALLAGTEEELDQFVDGLHRDVRLIRQWLSGALFWFRCQARRVVCGRAANGRAVGRCNWQVWIGLDFIGLDVCLAILEVLHEGLGDPKYRACPLLRRMVAAGHLGRKTKRGFYTY